MRMVLLSMFNRLTANFYPLQAINDATDDDIIDSHIRGVKTKQIKNPEELKLFRFGEFDDHTGKIELLDKPLLLLDLSKYADPVKVQEVDHEIARFISVSQQSN